ncbi:hypothetical protein [Streptomyces sp. ICBB 8177]|uniref:hypothetical protein n=1 Tax=Streptomyces sp. ICBB 8177 TaxID=563922 RepID=UPI0011B81538|nr:hypothetical protein [Streptomyces sp. ICBB 8177]
MGTPTTDAPAAMIALEAELGLADAARRRAAGASLADAPTAALLRAMTSDSHHRQQGRRALTTHPNRRASPGVTAMPVIAFVAQSVNQVIHGLRALPSTLTSTGHWT